MKPRFISIVCRTLVVLLIMSFVLSGAVSSAADGAAGKININQATVKELSKLPGIGKKKAEAIVAYRNEHGRFSSIDDITKIKGIGKKTFQKIKALLTAEDG